MPIIEEINYEYLAAAREVASSPSGWAIFCIAVGAKQIGEDTSLPRTVVLVLILLTSTNIRGMSLNRAYAALFSRNVIMSLEPLA